MSTASKEPTVLEMFDLDGKSALITGGTGWLGSALSRGLAETGASVVISSSRSAEAAQEAADRLPSPNGAKHYGVKLNHMEPESLEQGFKDAVTASSQLDILVNNGLEFVSHDLTDVTFEEFARHQANNAGYFVLARLMHEHAVKHGGGASIINLGSMYGLVSSYPDTYEGVSMASPVAYHSLKGGTIHMTRHLAAYYAKDNVRVNCLNPGPFPTADINKEMVRRLREKLPMKRMGLPHELKGALILLASDAGSYITGQNLTVDGGWTAW